MPEFFLQVAKALPAAFRSHLSAVVTGAVPAFSDVAGDLVDASAHGPSGRAATSRPRQRDLLPLVYGDLSAEDTPKFDSPYATGPTRARCRAIWTLLMIVTLNWHFVLGHAPGRNFLRAGPPTVPQYQSLVRLHAAADMICHLNPFEVSTDNWEAALSRASLSYTGEEVISATPLTFPRVLPTLPRAGVAGSIPIVPLLDGWTKEAVCNPELVRRSEDEVEEGWPAPRALLAKGECWQDYLLEFWRRGLVRIVLSHEVWRHRGKEVLNGVFGVEKPTSEEKKVVGVDEFGEPEKQNLLRLITNLVPANALQFRIDGDQGALPHSGQWSLCHLLPLELLLKSERDRFCFFYVFEMPGPWHGSMTLVGTIDGGLIGGRAGVQEQLGWVCPGMGWISSVGITQMAHRNMIFRCQSLPPAVLEDEDFSDLPGLVDDEDEVPQFSPVDESAFEEEREAAEGSDLHCFPLEPAAAGVAHVESPVFARGSEVRKDRMFPMAGADNDTSCWGVYIDNLLQDEIVHEGDASQLVGSTSPEMSLADARYAHWRSPDSSDKALNRVLDTTSLGYRFSGRIGRVDTPEGYLPKLIALTFWIVGRPEVEKRWMQILCGRWIRQFLHRRACMVSFVRVYRWLSRAPRRAQLPDDIILELLSACFLAPLAYTDMRLKLSPEVAATDASEAAGGLCRSVGLTALGLEQSRRTHMRLDGGSGDELLVVGLFDGIAAVRCGLEVLGLACCGFVSVEMDGPAKRVVAANWPGVEQVDDVCSVDEAMVRDWRRRYPSASYVLLSAGFPCQDLSQANQGRAGLAGRQSRLFWEFVRIRALLETFFLCAVILIMGENVEDMPGDALAIVTHALQVSPVSICASLFSWVRRPRLWWMNWCVAAFDGLSIERGQDLGGGFCVLKVVGPAVRGSCAEWLASKSSWCGEAEGRAMPTFLRWMPRKRPPGRPNGIASCSAADLELWERAQWACSPYFFALRNRISRASGTSTVASTLERERVMGFPARYTAPALTSSAAKGSKGLEFATRASLIGNSMSVHVCAWLLGILGLQLGFLERMPSRDSIRKRTAFECVSGYHAAAAGRALARARDLCPEQRLALWLCSQAGTRGSDVRLTTGQLTQPHRVKFQPVNAHWWRWRVVRGFAWKRPAHINELEARAGFAEVRRRCRSGHHIGTKYIHLFDSQVCIGICTKKRSSSKALARVTRRMNASELAAFLTPAYAFVRSADNPADRPSRSLRFAKKAIATRRLMRRGRPPDAAA